MSIDSSNLYYLEGTLCVPMRTAQRPQRRTSNAGESIPQ